MRRAQFSPATDGHQSAHINPLSETVPQTAREIKDQVVAETITLPEVAQRFGLPLSTLYRLAKWAPDNGVPIIKLSANSFRVNPRRFAEWLYAEAPGDILSGKHAGKGRAR